MKFTSIHKDLPFSDVNQDVLLKWSSRAIVDQLLHFYSITDGVEAHVEGSDLLDYIRVDDHDFMVDSDHRSASAECFEGLFQIGSDGAGQVLAFDLDRSGHPIVLHCPGFHDRGCAPIVAESLDDLMVKMGII